MLLAMLFQNGNDFVWTVLYCEMAKKRILEKAWGPQDEKQASLLQDVFQWEAP